MLSQLYIQNVAVISEATIDFSQGLNVFTGETGAGKTILINAINAVLGGRVSKDIIRTGESKAVVSAVFRDISGEICAEIERLGFSAFPEDDLLIVREIEADGRGSTKINGRPANLSLLRSVALLLISVHGQQDNYELLNVDRHIQYIDEFAASPQLHDAYGQEYARYMDLNRQLTALQMDESLKAQRLDMLTFQVNEIETAALQIGEEEALSSQKRLIKNSERIAQALGLCLEVLSGDGEAPGILELMESLDEGLSDAGKFLPEFEAMAAKTRESVYELEEISESVREQLESSEYDPRMLDKIESRLDVIYKLRKKYGSSVEEVLEHLERCRRELEELEFADERAEQLQQALAKSTQTLTACAAALTARRLEAAEQFIQAVQTELAFLDMPQVRLSVRHSTKDFAANGCDILEFFISPNAGEEPKPLAKIASGGEMARTMLSIKNVLSDREDIGTLIFDEVDTGVSGRAAQKIGQKLQEVSRNRQVICVTHLAQVASYAHRHLYIYKEVEHDRTFTKVAVLDREGRKQELARITGGEQMTELSLRHADELLQMAGN